jgi:hypothetical protein
MQASFVSGKSIPVSTLVIRVPNRQYDPIIVAAMVPEATKVKFGSVPYNGKPCFSAIFHFSTLAPPKVDKEALCIQIERYGLKVDARCGGGSVAISMPSTYYDIPIDHAPVGCKYDKPDALAVLRNICKQRGYTGRVNLTIMKSPTTLSLIARITSNGKIPMTDEEVIQLLDHHIDELSRPFCS